jgi:protein O-GlcNAc transferase
MPASIQIPETFKVTKRRHKSSEDSSEHFWAASKRTTFGPDSSQSHRTAPEQVQENAAPPTALHVELHKVAMLLEAQGDFLGAKAKYLEALKVKPDFAEAHCNLGNTLKLLGYAEEAEKSYRTALSHDPKLAPALGNLGAMCYEKGEIVTAKSLILKALELQPELSDAWNHLGNLTLDRGEPNTAISHYKRALTLQPGHPHALNNMGNALKYVGRRPEAREYYLAAIRVLPSSPAPHINLAALYKEHGDLSAALLHYQEVLRLCPTSAGAYCNLAGLYRDSSRSAEALTLYSLALSVDPTNLETHNHIGTIFKDSGRLEEALFHYSKAISRIGSSNVELRNFAEVFSNLAHTSLFLADYSHRDAILAQIEAMTRAQLASGQTPSVQPFHALVYPLPLSLIKEMSLAYATHCKRNISGRLRDFQSISQPVTRAKGSRLRVGYVSSDFVNHPLAHLMQSCFGLHDKERFQVFCFSLSPNDGSTYYKKISSEVECFYDVSVMTTFDLAKLINSLQIHVLFNLNGYTKGARNEIFVLQPSPVQVSYMGFCGTMGSPWIQYMITDAVACPRALESLYTEKLVHMPHSYFVNDHRQSNPNPKP